MAVTTTARTGVTRWSAGADPFTRAQMDASHASLESVVAGRIASTAGTRPAAAAANEGFLHFATDTKAFSYSDGAAWWELGGGGGFAKSFLSMGV